jgi:hypothetical protein
MTTPPGRRRYAADMNHMKKTVLTFGLISAAVSIGLMLASLPFLNTHGYETMDVIGYASMVAAALLVFFGIRSYRENAADGRLTFGRGLVVGLLITLISTLCYVVAFQLVYFKFVPDFGERFAACMVECARASGASAQEIDQTAKQAEMFKGMYDNPAANAALTFAMSFPIGLLASVTSAAILRKR